MLSVIIMLFVAKQQIEVNISQEIVGNLTLSVHVINLSVSYTYLKIKTN